MTPLVLLTLLLLIPPLHCSPCIHHKRHTQNLTAEAISYLHDPPTPVFNFHGLSHPPGKKFHPPKNQKQTAIRDAVKHAWNAYVKHAWGRDELRPLSKVGADNFAGLSTTIIDSLTTLYMLDMKHEYALARKYVQDELNFSSVGLVIVFETTIRILGSLISTFHLTADELYLRKAEELGVRLASSFETRNGLPWPRCYLNVTGVCTVHDNLGDSIYIAEVGTLQLEFRALSHHSRHPLVKRLRVVVERIVGYLQNAPSTTRRLSYEALVPYAMSLSKGMYNTNMVTLGAPADSYFEYLVKVWIQGGRRETAYWNMFADVVDGMLNIAVYTSSRGDTLVRDVLPDANGVKFQHKMDHFACFLPGAIILGIEGLPKNDERRGKWEWLATELTETCFNMYARSPSGLSGEHIRLGANDEWRMSGGYQLRPEALESFYYMYVYTGDEKYRRYAWAVFESIEKHCRLDEGYAALKSARSRHPKKEDVMHSFLISETFKYLYMIFGEDMLGDGWVLNTEAHPFLIMPGLDIGNDTCGEGQKAAYEEHDEL